MQSMDSIGQLFEKRLTLCRKIILWGNGRMTNSDIQELMRINTQILNLLEWLPADARAKLMTEITNCDRQIAEKWDNMTSGIVKLMEELAFQEQKTRICREIDVLEVRLAEKQEELRKLTKQKEDL